MSLLEEYKVIRLKKEELKRRYRVDIDFVLSASFSVNYPKLLTCSTLYRTRKNYRICCSQGRKQFMDQNLVQKGATILTEKQMKMAS